jgi:hypothetical protein
MKALHISQTQRFGVRRFTPTLSERSCRFSDVRPARSRRCVRSVPRRFVVVGSAFLGGPLTQATATPRFSAFPQRPLRLRVILFLFSPLATRHSPLLFPPESLLP